MNSVCPHCGDPKQNLEAGFTYTCSKCGYNIIVRNSNSPANTKRITAKNGSHNWLKGLADELLGW